jgi:O-antigen/teichoic acid export membrane protein
MPIKDPDVLTNQVIPSEPILPGSAGVQEDESQQEYFRTDHLLSGLKGRTISGGLVVISAQVGRFFLTLASTMVLSRLLSPRDFGLVAMVTTLLGFLRLFNDAGLSTATVQRDRITHAQVSNLFWTNIALGGGLSLLLAFLAPVIAWFYREPRLIGVTIALSVTFLMMSSSVQHLALLKRQMRFNLIASIQVCSLAGGVAIGIAMAFLNYGYWSLVGMQVSTSVLAGLLAWSFSPWRPQLPKRGSGTKSLLHFGAHLTASTFLSSLARGSDGILIGKFFGPISLGLYSRAAALMMRPLEQFTPPIEAVFVPAFARLQSQPKRYRLTVLQVYELAAVTGFVIGALTLALAYPLTLVVLGPKWASAAPIFAGFTFVVIYSPLASISVWILTSQGRGKDCLYSSIISSSVTLVVFLISLQYGPVAMAFAFSASALLIIMPVQYYIAGRRGPVRTRDLWVGFFTHLPVWVVIFIVTAFARTLVLHRGPVAQVLICVPIGLSAGFVFAIVYGPTRRLALKLLNSVRSIRGAGKSGARRGSAAQPADLPRSSQPQSASEAIEQKLLGTLVRKPRWGLSPRGWLFAMLILLLTGYGILVNVHPFLAATRRVDTNILVVEGWVNRYAIRAAAEEFKKGAYERIFATGGPVEGIGGYVNDYQTSASVGADLLKKAGIRDESLYMVPSRLIGHDRTYSSAVALRDWFHDHKMTVHGINVLTEDCHARRSRLLYAKAFGNDVPVGIIAVANPDYDAKHWWRYSDGVREVIGESIAYVYARLFFNPSERSHDKKAAESFPAKTGR